MREPRVLGFQRSNMDLYSKPPPPKSCENLGACKRHKKVLFSPRRVRFQRPPLPPAPKRPLETYLTLPKKVQKPRKVGVQKLLMLLEPRLSACNEDK